jgi:hypothetical protein
MTWITTTNQSRIQEWDRLFGLHALPVVNPEPLLIRMGRGVHRLVYILDTAVFTHAQRSRLAARIASEWGMTYNQALTTLDGLTISAEDCVTAENPHSAVTRFWRPPHKLYGRRSSVLQ